ncbi:PucR family transcriptional regulator, partial [Streptomyces sp. MT29]|nr:PucR family transcriptional regulator [Streptomyces sp. MT29]
MRRDTGAAALLGPLLAGSAQPHQVRRAAQGLGLPERGRYAVVVLGAPAVVRPTGTGCGGAGRRGSSCVGPGASPDRSRRLVGPGGA